MQRVSSQKDRIRVVVDEEIQFSFVCRLTGSGHSDVYTEGWEQSVEHCDVKAVKGVKRSDSWTKSEHYQYRNWRALDDDYETFSLERQIRKAERISDVQKSLLLLADTQGTMVSRSLSRSRTRVDQRITRSVSRERRKEGKQKAESVDIAGNFQNVPTKRKKKSPASKNASVTSSDRNLRKQTGKKLEARVEPIKRYTRTQSESLDHGKISQERDAGYSTNRIQDRGRKMERRCQSSKRETDSKKAMLSFSMPLAEKGDQDSYSEVKAKMVDEMSYTIVELEDISHVFKSDPHTRSISLTRLVADMKNKDGNSSLKVRKSRSLSRNRSQVLNNRQSYSQVKQFTKSARTYMETECSSQIESNNEPLPFCRPSWRQRNKTTPLFESMKKNSSILQKDSETFKPGYNVENRGVPNSDSLSEEDFGASEDEETRPPTFVCRCCDAEFTSRFDLHEHLVDFHRITKCTAVLPSRPSETNLPYSANSSFESESSSDRRTSTRRRHKKSVSFSVDSSDSLREYMDITDSPKDCHKSNSGANEAINNSAERSLLKDFNLKNLSVSVERCELNSCKIKSKGRRSNRQEDNDSRFVIDTTLRENDIKKQNNQVVKTTIEISPYEDMRNLTEQSPVRSENLSQGMKKASLDTDFGIVHSVEIYEPPEMTSSNILNATEMTCGQETLSLSGSRKRLSKSEGLGSSGAGLIVRHVGQKLPGEDIVPELKSSRENECLSKSVKKLTTCSSSIVEIIDTADCNIEIQETASKCRRSPRRKTCIEKSKGKNLPKRNLEKPTDSVTENTYPSKNISNQSYITEKSSFDSESSKKRRHLNGNVQNRNEVNIHLEGTKKTKELITELPPIERKQLNLVVSSSESRSAVDTFSESEEGKSFKNLLSPERDNRYIVKNIKSSYQADKAPETLDRNCNGIDQANKQIHSSLKEKVDNSCNRLHTNSSPPDLVCVPEIQRQKVTPSLDSVILDDQCRSCAPKHLRLAVSESEGDYLTKNGMVSKPKSRTRKQNTYKTTGIFSKLKKKSISLLHNRSNFAKRCKIDKDINDNDQICVTNICQDNIIEECKDAQGVDTEIILKSTKSPRSDNKTYASDNAGDSSISGKVTVLKDSASKAADLGEDENVLLKEFIKRENIRVDFGQYDACKNNLAVEVDSKELQADLDSGYDEKIVLLKMLFLLGELDLSRYENGNRNNSDTYDKTEFADKLHETSAELVAETSRRVTQFTEFNCSQPLDSVTDDPAENTPEEKEHRKEELAEKEFIQNNSLTQRVKNKEIKTGMKTLQKNRKSRKDDKQSKENVKTTKTNKKENRTAGLGYETANSKVDSECYGSVVSEELDAERNCLNENQNMLDDDMRGASLPFKSDQKLGNRLIESDSTNEQYIFSHDENKTEKGIKIRLKRKKKVIESDDEVSLNDFEKSYLSCDGSLDSQHSLIADNLNDKGSRVSKSLLKRRKVETEKNERKQSQKTNKAVREKSTVAESAANVNKYYQIKRNIPVIRLERISFVKKLEIDGLRLKFKGTKSKPYWKVKNCHSAASCKTSEIMFTNQKDSISIGAEMNCSGNEQIRQKKIANKFHDFEAYTDDIDQYYDLSTVDKDHAINSTVDATCLSKSSFSPKQSAKKSGIANKETENRKVDSSYLSMKEDSNKVNKKEDTSTKRPPKSYEIENRHFSTSQPSTGSKMQAKANNRNKVKLKEDIPLTEFDRALLNSGKHRKDKLKQTKKPSSVLRKKSSDSNESQPEMNREIVSGKLGQNPDRTENNSVLLLKSKIAQKIVSNDQREKNLREQQELPGFPVVSDSNTAVRPLSHLKKSLESLGSVKNLINSDPNSITLKDSLSEGLPEFKNPFEAATCKKQNSTVCPFSFSKTYETTADKVGMLQQSNTTETRLAGEKMFLHSDKHLMQKDQVFSKGSGEELSECVMQRTPRQGHLNVQTTIRSPDVLTDSAFSSPECFDEIYLSPKFETSKGNIFQDRFKLLSSTPADINATCKKRNNHINLGWLNESVRAEEPFAFMTVDQHFPDLSGIEAKDDAKQQEFGLDEIAHSDEYEHRNEMPVASKNSGSLEILSAEASGFDLSSPCGKLSETQTKETIQWYKKKQTELPELSSKTRPAGKTVELRQEKSQKTSTLKAKPKLKRLEITHTSSVACKVSSENKEKSAEKCQQKSVTESERELPQESQNFGVEVGETESQKSCSSVNDVQSDSVAVNLPENLLVDIQGSLFEKDSVENNPSRLPEALLTSFSSNEQYYTIDETGFDIDIDQNFGKTVDGNISDDASKLTEKESYKLCDNNRMNLVKSIMYFDDEVETTEIRGKHQCMSPQEISSADDNYKSVQEKTKDNDKNSVVRDVRNQNYNELAEYKVEAGQDPVENNDMTNSNSDMIENETNDAKTGDESQLDTMQEEEDIEDASDESSEISVDLAEDDVEKVDVLSLYASDDASFLEEEEEDVIVKMGVDDKKKSDSLMQKVERDVSSGSSSRATSVTDDPNLVDMDIEEASSPSHSANAPIQVNTATTTPQQRQLMKDMIPAGYCHYFNTAGNCNNGNKCRFRHEKPSKEIMVQHWKVKLDQLLRTGELDRALAVFGEVSATEFVTPQRVLHLFSQCRQAGNVNCYTLVKYMFDNGFLTADIINQFIYMCGNNPTTCFSVLWEVFQRMVNLNIQPANDAMLILLRTFSDCEAWEWLWQVMLYCNEAENFIMPVFCQERALRAMLAEPGRYFNYAVQWLMSSSVDKLQRLDEQILQEICQLSVKLGETKLPLGLNQIITADRNTPRLRTPVIPSYNGREVEDYAEDDETVRSWMNRFHGLQYSKNWDYLGELYVERSTLHCPIPAQYINKITEILKKNEYIEEVFADFLACAFKRYETESREDETTRLDTRGLAVIGNNLLKLSAETHQWKMGYQILCHMANYNISYLSSGDQHCHTPVIAMEICLQCSQPISALQILKETNINSSDNLGIRFLHNLFPHLIQQLMVEYKFLDCYYVLSVGYSVAYGSNDHHQQNISTTLEESTCRLIEECLRHGDIPTAVKTFKLYVNYRYPFVIGVLLSRSLLVACLETRHEEVAQSVYDMLRRRNVYSRQRIEKPRTIILPMWMSYQEMCLVIKEYLQWLYNTLCSALLENIRPTQADLQLTVRLVSHPVQNNQQVPFLSGIPLSVTSAQKMVLGILNSELVPGVNAAVLLDGTIRLEPASLERWLCETDKNSRRQGLVFQQSVMSRTGMSIQHRNRGALLRTPRPRVPR